MTEEERQQRLFAAKKQMEEQNLPAVTRIIGAGGENTATLVFTDGRQMEAKEDDILPRYFRVIDVGPRSITLRGLQTDTTYTVVPGKAPDPEADASGNGGASGRPVRRLSPIGQSQPGRF